MATKSALSDAAEEAHYLRANLLVTHTLLAALREHAPACRTFLAGSCHMFGDTKQRPQTEDTPFAPNSLYGLTKVASAQLGRIYREKHRMFVGTGILYNHESPLRRTDFVSAKIAKGAVDVLRGTRHEIDLADVETEVDWGFAGEYAAAMIAMTGAQVAEDFIIASGTVHRVKDFARLAFERVGLDWTKHVRQASPGDRSVARTVYQGDISRIRERLGWSPKTTFAQLVAMMVDHHLAQNPA